MASPSLNGGCRISRSDAEKHDVVHIFVQSLLDKNGTIV
jgi:hypothetical protein